MLEYLQKGNAFSPSFVPAGTKPARSHKNNAASSSMGADASTSNSAVGSGRQ
jgi:hypothetical protein